MDKSRQALAMSGIFPHPSQAGCVVIGVPYVWSPGSGPALCSPGCITHWAGFDGVTHKQTLGWGLCSAWRKHFWAPFPTVPCGVATPAGSAQLWMQGDSREHPLQPQTGYRTSLLLCHLSLSNENIVPKQIITEKNCCFLEKPNHN